MGQRIRKILVPAVLLWPALGFGGGPRWVAGSSYFDPAAKGKRVVWAGGAVSYFTDQGALSASVTNSQANAMVANAALVWNGVPTAGVNIFSGGSLGEDVSGANVTAGPNGPILPADIQPVAIAQPVAIVYDADGSVIDTLYGAGASNAATCQQSGVFTVVDNMTTTGNLAHALMIVNGLCAAGTAQLAILEYQMVRGFGRILGLDWSQTNEEHFASAQETSSDLSGWPILHPIERLCHATGESCTPNGTVLRFDDVAALNRLYPVTAANIASFAGKQLTAENTISVQGTISFKNGQGMQGVNVVLRPLTPGTGLPDVRYTVTAVSGAFFQGSAANPVTGATPQATSNPPTQFGSDDQTLEGFFDLSGVPLPPGETASDYQLSFEPINPLDTQLASVGPYLIGQVTPSGTMPTLVLSQLQAGSVTDQAVMIEDSSGELQRRGRQ